MNPLHPNLGRVYAALRVSAQLEKQAAASFGDTAIELRTRKVANDNHIFELVKSAAGVMGSVLDVAKNVASHPIGKGFMYAAGAAVPAAMAVDHMSNHAAEEMRNKALQTAGGLAAMGGTLYGLHHMFQPAQNGQKIAGDEGVAVEAALKKLASVGYLDEMLGAVEGSEDTKKLAAELRILNREFGVEIIRNLIG